MIGGSADFWGGQKWLRRFLAPGLFGVWSFLRSGLNWRYLPQAALMMAASTLPYGADNLGLKWLLRGVFGVANGAASSFTNFLEKRWLLAGFQVVLVVSVSIMAGVYNPFPNAMIEMFFIGFIIVLIPALSVQKK